MGAAGSSTPKGIDRPRGAGVFRFLPEPYRKAGRATPAYVLCRTAGRAIDLLDRDAKAAVQAHTWGGAGDLTDCARLAAWFREQPWPDEDVAGFRRRVERMVAVYLRGAANAERMLAVVEGACGAHIVTTPGGRRALLRPRTTDGLDDLVAGQVFRTDRFQTLALLQRDGAGLHNGGPGGAGPAPFEAIVEDLPQTRRQIGVGPVAGGLLDWSVTNPLYGEPPDPFVVPQLAESHPNPVIRIATGAAELRWPVIVQVDLRRAVLVNRILPPGCTLDVDLAQHVVTTPVPGSAAPLPGGLTADDGSDAPDLLYGTGAVLGESRWSTPMDAPAHAVRWYPFDALDLGAEEPLQPMAAAPERLAWPGLLRRGDTRWRLLVGQAAAPPGRPAVATLRFRRRSAGTMAATVTIRWLGRSPGTFTIRLDRAQLSPDGAGPRQYREAWFLEQVARLKLAGTVFVPPEQTVAEQALPPVSQPAGTPHPVARTLETPLRATDHVHVAIARGEPPPAERTGRATDTVGLGDRLHTAVDRGSNTVERDAADRLALSDALATVRDAAPAVDWARTLVDDVTGTDALGVRVEPAPARSLPWHGSALLGLEDSLAVRSTPAAAGAGQRRALTERLGLTERLASRVRRGRPR